MIKSLDKFIKEDFCLIIGIIIYLIFILGWYYKPPWLIDHNIYLHIAKALDVQDLNWWKHYRSSLPEGHHNERWTLLSLIIIFDKIFFFLTPGIASQVLLVCTYTGILILTYYILLNYNNKIIANIFVIFWVFASHHTKNRATEFLAEPFAVFFTCLAILSFILFKKKNNQIFIFLASFSMVSIPLTKIHLGILSLLIFIIYFKIIKNYIKYFIVYCIVTVIFFNIVLLVNYGTSLYLIVIENSLRAYQAYLGGGLSVGKGPEIGGWLKYWFELIMSRAFLMPIYFLSALFLFSRKYENKNIFGWLSIIFLITIFLLSSFANFPANSSYAFPLYIFTIACLAIFTGEFLNEKNNNIVQYTLIILCSIIPLIAIYNLGAEKNNNFFYSFFVLTVLLTLIFVPYIYLKKTYMSFYILLIFISINIFWNNWKHLEEHSWWRNGYNKPYIILKGAAKLIKNFDNEKVAVYFSSWPIVKGQKWRWKSVIEPGIRSLIRNDVDIYGFVGDKELPENLTLVEGINFNKNFNYLISDKFINQLKLIDEIEILTTEDKDIKKLYLYNLINEN